MADAHDHAGGRIPFWIHQLVELLLGILLLVQGARSGEHTAELVTLGCVLLLLALCTDGAFGAWTWIGRRLHRTLDVVVAAALALSPLVFGFDHALAIVIVEIAAAAMLWLAFRTEWRTRAARKPARPAPASPTPSTPSTSPPVPSSTPPSPSTPASPSKPPSPPTPAVPVARKLGSAVGKARDDGPRQLGRLVGRAQRAAKAAMTPDPAPPQPSEGLATPPDSPEGAPPP